MALPLTPAYRDKICVQIANRLGHAHQAGEIDAFDFQDACKAVISAIDTISSFDQLVQFLQKLGSQWPCFLDIHKTIVKENQNVENIEKMFYGRGKATNQ